MCFNIKASCTKQVPLFAEFNVMQTPLNTNVGSNALKLLNVALVMFFQTTLHTLMTTVCGLSQKAHILA